MFTGIVREIGIVESIDAKDALRRLCIQAKFISAGVKEGDSIAVNGTCLTIVENKNGALGFDVMKETLDVTTLGLLKSGDRVNIEPALELGQNRSLSGHLVTGHIDEVGAVTRVMPHGAGTKKMELGISEVNMNLVVQKGSVAIEGVSLTVSGIAGDRFTVDLIPYTLKETTLGMKKPGDKVNIEFDIIGKYVARNVSGKSSGSITTGFLTEHGFI
jgi:riboflavin synthase